MATQGENERRPWYRTYRTSLVLAVLGVVGVIAAVMVFPRWSSVEVDGGGAGGVAVLTTFTPSNIDIAEHTRGTTLTVTVVVRASEATEPHPGEITIVLPVDSWGSPRSCPGATDGCKIDAGSKVVSYDLARLTWVSSSGSDPEFRYELPLTIVVPAGGSNVASNDEYISTLLPPVRVQVAPSGDYRSARDVVVPVKYTEQVGHAGYTWSVGTAPTYLGGSYGWTYTSAADVQSAVSATLDSGTNLSVQDRATKLAFLSGALIGVGGGALVGALQTALDAQAEGRDERSRHTTAPPTP
jgi:hypothetical protein